MTNNQKMECNAIIHSASGAAAAVGAGLAQIPLSDSVAISAIQTAMTISLGEVFGLDISESSAKGLGTSGVARTLGRAVAAVLAGWIPGVGNAINAGTAGLLTETLGWAIAAEFEKRSQRIAYAD